MVPVSVARKVGQNQQKFQNWLKNLFKTDLEPV